MPVATRGDRNREHTLTTAAYTLAINGIAAATEHETLENATALLQATLDSLPIAPSERSAYQWFLAEPERVRDYIARDGLMTFTFRIGDTRYTAVIQSAG